MSGYVNIRAISTNDEINNAVFIASAGKSKSSWVDI